MERDAPVSTGPNARKSQVNAAGPKTGKRRAAVEICVGYLLILLVEWTPRPWQRFVWIAAAAGIAIIVWRSFEGWRALGFTTANLARASWIAGAALTTAAIAIAIAAHLHTLRLPPGGVPGFVATYVAYAIWTGVQQFLLQGFFLVRLQHLIPGRTAALAAAGLFAAAHFPNPILMPVTLIWGIAACLLFLRYRNIYPLMIAHAILGITVAMAVPGPAVHNMRVGLGYLTYSRYAHRHHSRGFQGIEPPPAPPSTQP